MMIRGVAIGGLYLALAGFVPSAEAGGACTVFFDQGQFEAFCAEHGKFLKGIEDFEPPVGDVPFGEIAGPLVDPLQGNVPNVDPANGFGFPNGLANKNLFIQSNQLGPNAPDPLPGGGLVALGPGHINGDNVPNSIVVGSDSFADSTDLIFPPGEDHTGVGFDVIDPIGLNVVHITVFDQGNLEIAKEIIDVTDLKTFFGIWCAEPIGRINLAGMDVTGAGGGELVDNIQMWMEPAQAPVCPWDCGAPRNKMVDVVDFLALLAQWGQVGVPCDFDGGGVSVTDFLKMLAAWGPCPMPSNDKCEEALKITALDDGVLEEHFDMYGATVSFEPYKCIDEPPTHKDIWYCLNNDANLFKGVRIWSNLPLLIEVNEGCSCPPGALVACGDGTTGTEQFVMPPGAQVLIRVVDWFDLPNEELKGSIFIEIKPGSGDPVNFFDDRVQFEFAALEAGMVMKGTWAFKPDYLQDGAAAAITDPLDLTTHPNNAPGVWWDGEVDLWPPEIDNVQFTANMTPGGPLTPRGAFGMWYGKPGAVPELNNNALVANNFVDSFDIVSGPPAGDNHTGMGLDLIGLDTDGVPNTVTLRVIVYDKNDLAMGEHVVTAVQGEKPFVGILTKSPVITIGRVDITDLTGFAEGISAISLWFPAPACDDCADGTVNTCDGDPACHDCLTPDGECRCVQQGSCGLAETCPDGNCPPGYFCCVNTCCDEPVCLPLCGSPPATPPGEVKPGDLRSGGAVIDNR